MFFVTSSFLAVLVDTGFLQLGSEGGVRAQLSHRVAAGESRTNRTIITARYSDLFQAHLVFCHENGARRLE